MYGEENHFRSDPRRRDNAPSEMIFVPLSQAGNPSAERRDRRQRKCARTQKFLEAMQEGCYRALKFCTFGAGKPNLTADQKLYERDDRVHQGT